MAEEYVCGDCGQRAEEEFCPLCESKMIRIDDFSDDFACDSEEEENSGYMAASDDFDFDGFGEDGLAEAA